MDENTRRALCVWRDLTGRPITRKLAVGKERPRLLKITRPKPSARLVTGLNISRTCQAATWVDVTKVNKTRYIRAVFIASTGMTGHETRVGLFHIYMEQDKWLESTLYPGAMMYRPKFFSGGQAVHGSATDALVLPYPASHGCVRMLHSAINQLWASGVGIGTKVLVYGNWNG
jgi:lipoprotein-anchoring transpeptidase ErfK/SrfK